MTRKKVFYGAYKQKDIKDFNEAIKGLTELYGEAKNKKGLAQKLGVSTSTLRSWETGKSKPSAENFFKLKNTYNAYKPTIRNKEKKEKFIEKNKRKPKAKKRIQKKKENKFIITSANKWLDKHFHERYKEATKYEYFRMLMNEKGLLFVGYYQDNPKEGIFLKDKKQNIIKETFMHMVGITHSYPYEKANEQIFIRRIPRLATGIRNLDNVKKDTEKARSIFYSGNNADKIENFFGYYFDS